jgi:plasmid replication initiation protein
MPEIAQLDLFTVSALDPPWRDNRDAMEYPFLSLQKHRTEGIEYHARGVSIEVQAPAKYGLASIWDWDLIIFAASHLNDAIEAGRAPSPRIRFVPHDCLKQLRRGTGGKDYKELAASIRRLKMTTVITNLREDDTNGEERAFSWLTSYSIPKRYSATPMTSHEDQGTPDPARPWEIELPPWLYNAILRRREILAVHPDYFDLTGGLERWLYRLARKAVPDKAEVAAIHFRMETLHERSGTTRPLKKFAFDIRRMAQAQPLPEYSISISREGKHELVILYRDRAKSPRLPRGIKRLQIEGKAAKAA